MAASSANAVIGYALATRTTHLPTRSHLFYFIPLAHRHLVEHRLRTFAYLKDVYQGNRHFLSVISLNGSTNKEDGLEENMVLRWFYLGVSLATLLQQPPGAPFVRSALQLLEELQHHFSSSRSAVIRTRPAAMRPRPAAIGDGDDLTPSLQRVNGKVMYENLLTPHVAHALSGVQVAIGLCDLLCRIYRKLAECPGAASSSAAAAISEAVLRIDGRLEEHFINPVTTHAESLSRKELKSNLGRLEPLFGRMWGQQGGAARSLDDAMERTEGTTGQVSGTL